MAQKIKRTTDEIERESDWLLGKSLDSGFRYLAYKLNHYALGKLKERGIDFIYEISKRSEIDSQHQIDDGIALFYVQNKGIDTPIKINKTGINKGLISHQLDEVRHIEYFCKELDQPTVITLCDIVSNQVYWLPIQLEYERYAREVEKIKIQFRKGDRKTQKIQIYFDPNNRLLDENGKIQSSKLEELIKDLFKSKDLLVDRYQESRVNSQTRDEICDRINLSAHILDQIVQLFDIIFDELDFIHPWMLATFPPFDFQETDTGRRHRSYTEDFTMITHNPSIYNLFKSFHLNKDDEVQITNNEFFSGVEDIENKLIQVVKRLNRNNIFEMRCNHEPFSIRFRHNATCNCSHCLYEGFEFERFQKSIKQDSSDFGDQLARSAIQFKLGAYRDSLETILKAKEQVPDDKKVLHFLMDNNIKTLPYVVNSDGEYINELNQEISKINLDHVFCHSKSNLLFDVIKDVYRGSYLKATLREMTKLSNKIISQYHSSLRRSTYRSGFANALYAHFANFYSFTRANNILHHRNGSFEEIIDGFVEGIYAAHGNKNVNHSRLVHLDDWILSVLIRESNSDSLIRYFNRYRLQKIDYQNKDFRDGKIHSLIVKIFKNYKKNNAVLNVIADNSWHGSSTLDRPIRNAIVLSAQIDFGEEGNRVIAHLIRDFTRDSAIYGDIKYLEYYFNRKASEISSATLKSVFMGSIRRTHIHDGYFWGNFCDSVRMAKKKFNLSDSQFKEVVELASLNDESISRRQGSELLSGLYNLTENESHKQRLRQASKELVENSNDDLDLNNALIYGVIELEETHIDYFIDQLRPKEEVPSLGVRVETYFSEANNTDLSAFINVCFKFEVDMTTRKFDGLRGRNAYYDWLLNMDRFDYSHFKADWITYYQTKYYFKRMCNSNALKIALEDYLKSDDSIHAQEVLNAYVNIYIRRTWEDVER